MENEYALESLIERGGVLGSKKISKKPIKVRPFIISSLTCLGTGLVYGFYNPDKLDAIIAFPIASTFLQSFTVYDKDHKPQEDIPSTRARVALVSGAIFNGVGYGIARGLSHGYELMNSNIF